MTPMMQQYLEIKSRYEDAILFYRLGDFYEMFFDDAYTASRELELTLTGRSCGEDERAPMCGVPFHSADSYIAKLVSKGYKVVVCEQMEDPATAKGLVKRGIVRIVTRGSMIDGDQLDGKKSNYTVSLCKTETSLCAAFCDISTGEISAAFYPATAASSFSGIVAAYEPSEVLLPGKLSDFPSLSGYFKGRGNCFINEDNADLFDGNECRRRFIKQFGPESAEKADEKSDGIIVAVGALISYISETQLTEENNIRELTYIGGGDCMELDATARRNLELCEAMRTGEKKGSLLWVLDSTRTSPGSRLLRRWIEQPLLDVNEIVRRQEAIAELSEDLMLRDALSTFLGRVLDLDRLVTKMVYKTANARDLRAICSTVSVFPDIKAALSDCKSEFLTGIRDDIDCLTDVREIIDAAISDEPPVSVREGGIIKRGYRSDADELYEIVHDAKKYIAGIEEKERSETGIKTLKISYNRVFGYYIEVTNSYLKDVPDRYIRKQTLVGAERFITEELKEKESMIAGASDKLVALEYELFCEIRDAVAAQLIRIQNTMSAISKLDCCNGLAEVAVKNDYVRPEVDYSDVISIKDGRHPVVEKFSSGSGFVPNDALLDCEKNAFMTITGPNMSGKSTYMRQVAIITLMAQIGSFVPCSSARIGIADRIFTRVGASDDLASGTSTFMLEMNEVAFILKNATRRSLIIYDEIGRGTSTFDGMAIARSVAEYTRRKIGCRTMFATHYHELISLSDEMDGVVNYNVSAKKKGDDVIFLRKILPGGTDDSFGIEVAKLAGIPNEIVRRAREILKQLESGTYEVRHKRNTAEVTNNLTIDDIKAVAVREKLLKTDINTLTPVEALNLLSELCDEAK